MKANLRTISSYLVLTIFTVSQALTHHSVALASTNYAVNSYGQYTPVTAANNVDLGEEDAIGDQWDDYFGDDPLSEPDVEVQPDEKIQDAIDRAEEGDVILVPPGVYDRDANITLKKDQTLVGVSDPLGNKPEIVMTGYVIMAEGSTIKNLKVSRTYGAAIIYAPSNATDTTIESIDIDNGYLYINSQGNTIQDNTIVRDNGTTMYLYEGDNIVTGNVFHAKNRSSGTVVNVYSRQTGGNIFDMNTIVATQHPASVTNNSYGILFYNGGASQSDQIFNTIVAGTGYGIYSAGAPVEVSYSLIESTLNLGWGVQLGDGVLVGVDPLLTDPENGIYTLQPGSQAIGAGYGTKADGTRLDIGARQTRAANPLPFSFTALVEYIQNVLHPNVTAPLQIQPVFTSDHLTAATAIEFQGTSVTYHLYIYSSQTDAFGNPIQIMHYQGDGGTVHEQIHNVQIDDTGKLVFIQRSPPGSMLRTYLDIFEIGASTPIKSIEYQPLCISGQGCINNQGAIRITDHPGSQVSVEVYPHAGEVAAGTKLDLNATSSGIQIQSENNLHIPQDVLRDLPTIGANDNYVVEEKSSNPWTLGGITNYHIYTPDGQFVTTIIKSRTFPSASSAQSIASLGFPDASEDGEYIIHAYEGWCTRSSSGCARKQFLGIWNGTHGSVAHTIELRNPNDDAVTSTEFDADNPYHILVTYASGDVVAYDAETGQLAQLPVPEGWTRADSNPEFALRVACVSPSSGGPAACETSSSPVFQLQLLNLVNGQEMVVATSNSSSSTDNTLYRFTGKYDVSPDGRHVVYESKANPYFGQKFAVHVQSILNSHQKISTTELAGEADSTLEAITFGSNAVTLTQRLSYGYSGSEMIKTYDVNLSNLAAGEASWNLITQGNGVVVDSERDLVIQPEYFPRAFHIRVYDSSLGVDNMRLIHSVILSNSSAYPSNDNEYTIVDSYTTPLGRDVVTIGVKSTDRNTQEIRYVGSTIIDLRDGNRLTLGSAIKNAFYRGAIAEYLVENHDGQLEIMYFNLETFAVIPTLASVDVQQSSAAQVRNDIDSFMQLLAEQGITRFSREDVLNMAKGTAESADGVYLLSQMDDKVAVGFSGRVSNLSCRLVCTRGTCVTQCSPSSVSPRTAMLFSSNASDSGSLIEPLGIHEPTFPSASSELEGVQMAITTEGNLVIDPRKTGALNRLYDANGVLIGLVESINTLAGPPLPEGWTRAESNPNFAFRVRQVGTTTILELMDLVKNMAGDPYAVQTLTGVNNINPHQVSHISQIRDVSPDGKTVVFGIDSPTHPSGGNATVRDVENGSRSKSISGRLVHVSFYQEGDLLIRTENFLSSHRFEKFSTVDPQAMITTRTAYVPLNTNSPNLHVDHDANLVIAAGLSISRGFEITVLDSSEGLSSLQRINSYPLGADSGGDYTFLDAYITSSGRRLVSVGINADHFNSGYVVDVDTGERLFLPGSITSVTYTQGTPDYATYNVVRQNGRLDSLVVNLETFEVEPVIIRAGQLIRHVETPEGQKKIYRYSQGSNDILIVYNLANLEVDQYHVQGFTIASDIKAVSPEGRTMVVYDDGPIHIIPLVTGITKQTLSHPQGAGTSIELIEYVDEETIVFHYSNRRQFELDLATLEWNEITSSLVAENLRQFRFLDQNQDGTLSLQEIRVRPLAVINYLNQTGGGPVAPGSEGEQFDINGDGFVSSIDALVLINFIGVVKRTPNNDAIDEGLRLNIVIFERFDTNNDGTIRIEEIRDNPLALRIVTYLSQNPEGPVDPNSPEAEFDINGDGEVTALDSLLVINFVGFIRETPNNPFIDEAERRIFAMLSVIDTDDDFKISYDEIISYYYDHLSPAWGSSQGDTRYREELDINGDGVINHTDWNQVINLYYGRFSV